MKLNFILIFFLSLNCFGQTVKDIIAESRESNYQIDWKYKSGEYLIYDCERRHYACVNIDGDNNCREERKFAIETKAATYPCASLAKYKNKKLCVEKNYQVVDTTSLHRFCYPK